MRRNFVLAKKDTKIYMTWILVIIATEGKKLKGPFQKFSPNK